MGKKKEEALNALIKPIRKWLAGNNKRNALVILSEPRAKTQLVLATNTTGKDMIPDIGMIVGMEPQLCDTLSLILDESMHIEPVETNEPDWEDTIDYTASSSGRPEEWSYDIGSGMIRYSLGNESIWAENYIS